uniref:Uncharacterized protein n=1 Tax=Triticum urartu TaxID=4572 RepID=A0A8R7PDF9_TRIUA
RHPPSRRSSSPTFLCTNLGVQSLKAGYFTAGRVVVWILFQFLFLFHIRSSNPFPF